MIRLALQSVTVAAAVLLASALPACTTGTYDRAAIQAETFTIRPPHAVFDTPQVVAARRGPASGFNEAAPLVDRDQAEPWWATRNDDRLAVRVGSNQARYGGYEVYTRDRQYSWSGRIDNSYRREARSYTRGYLVQ